MRADLIDDLQSGFDPTPDYQGRELYRLDNLCKEAATELADLRDAVKWLDEDPYKVLSRINVNDHIEKKSGLSYLSWAWAWDTLMDLYPDSENGINRQESGLPYWTDGMTCWVDVYVTLRWGKRSRTRSEVFPIMDYKNRSIPLTEVTSFHVNTALQRAWTKCIARHGLGFYIYAGQDLPNEEAEKEKAKAKTPVTYEQIEKIEKLYTENEIGTMLKRLKKSAITMITQAQAETMIKKRDTSLIEDQTPTF